MAEIVQRIDDDEVNSDNIDVSWSAGVIPYTSNPARGRQRRVFNRRLLVENQTTLFRDVFQFTATENADEKKFADGDATLPEKIEFTFPSFVSWIVAIARSQVALTGFYSGRNEGAQQFSDCNVDALFCQNLLNPETPPGEFYRPRIAALEAHAQINQVISIPALQFHSVEENCKACNKQCSNHVPCFKDDTLEFFQDRLPFRPASYRDGKYFSQQFGSKVEVQRRSGRFIVKFENPQLCTEALKTTFAITVDAKYDREISGGRSIRSTTWRARSRSHSRVRRPSATPDLSPTRSEGESQSRATSLTRPAASGFISVEHEEQLKLEEFKRSQLRQIVSFHLGYDSVRELVHEMNEACGHPIQYFDNLFLYSSKIIDSYMDRCKEILSGRFVDLFDESMQIAQNSELALNFTLLKLAIYDLIATNVQKPTSPLPPEDISLWSHVSRVKRVGLNDAEVQVVDPTQADGVCTNAERVVCRCGLSLPHDRSKNQARDTHVACQPVEGKRIVMISDIPPGIGDLREIKDALKRLLDFRHPANGGEGYGIESIYVPSARVTNNDNAERVDDETKVSDGLVAIEKEAARNETQVETERLPLQEAAEKENSNSEMDDTASTRSEAPAAAAAGAMVRPFEHTGNAFVVFYDPRAASKAVSLRYPFIGGFEVRIDFVSNVCSVCGSNVINARCKLCINRAALTATNGRQIKIRNMPTLLRSREVTRNRITMTTREDKRRLQIEIAQHFATFCQCTRNDVDVLVIDGRFDAVQHEYKYHTAPNVFALVEFKTTELACKALSFRAQIRDVAIETTLPQV